MDNEFGDKTQPSLKSKFVDVRIVLTDLEYNRILNNSNK